MKQKQVPWGAVPIPPGGNSNSPSGEFELPPRGVQRGPFGPKWAHMDFEKLVDLEIWTQGPWLKNSEPSYVSSYGPGRYLGPEHEAVSETKK